MEVGPEVFSERRSPPADSVLAEVFTISAGGIDHTFLRRFQAAQSAPLRFPAPLRRRPDPAAARRAGAERARPAGGHRNLDKRFVGRQICGVSETIAAEPAEWRRALIQGAAWKTFRLLLPLGLLLLGYKLHGLWPEAWRGRIRVAELHAWELRWFGVSQGDALVTPAAWWQAHTHPALDAVAGAAYLIFVPAFVVSAFWWSFMRRREAMAERAMWALLAMYLAGYVTYFVYPAAPPWYFDHYGAAIVPRAPPEAAGALRFDALVGAPVFVKYYGQSVNVFGAVPSLHCATAFLGLLFALRLRSLRAASLALFIAVTFAAVYLNHHYLVDAVLGAAYAAAAFGLFGLGRQPR